MDSAPLFGRYRLLEPAGTGGTAQVWRALDERTGEEVAVKRLHPVVFASEAGRARLVREFRALRHLRHPNVVTVRDLEFGTDEAALILDFVPGPSLRDRLAAGIAIPPPEAVAIADDVAAALDAAHRAGLVHRDVSPGNILLDPGGRARLTDFGIARATGDESAVTATGLLVGTLRYVAPEQLRGEPATPASDLFGLAAVTYEMLAGRPPFPATTPVALVEAQRSGPPPIDNVDPALDAAVRGGLAIDPGDRPASVRAFTERLRAAAGATAVDEDAPTVAIPLAAVAAGSIAGAAAAPGASGVRTGSEAATPREGTAADAGTPRHSGPAADRETPRDRGATPDLGTPRDRGAATRRLTPLGIAAALALGAVILAAASGAGPSPGSDPGGAVAATASPRVSPIPSAAGVPADPTATPPAAPAEPVPAEPAPAGDDGDDAGNEGDEGDRGKGDDRGKGKDKDD